MDDMSYITWMFFRYCVSRYPRKPYFVWPGKSFTDYSRIFFRNQLSDVISPTHLRHATEFDKSNLKLTRPARLWKLCSAFRLWGSSKSLSCNYRPPTRSDYRISWKRKFKGLGYKGAFGFANLPRGRRCVSGSCRYECTISVLMGSDCAFLWPPFISALGSLCTVLHSEMPGHTFVTLATNGNPTNEGETRLSDGPHKVYFQPL